MGANFGPKVEGLGTKRETSLYRTTVFVVILQHIQFAADDVIRGKLLPFYFSKCMPAVPSLFSCHSPRRLLGKKMNPTARKLRADAVITNTKSLFTNCFTDRFTDRFTPKTVSLSYFLHSQTCFTLIVPVSLSTTFSHLSLQNGAPHGSIFTHTAHYDHP